MKRALLLLPLLGCGPGPESAFTSLELALSAELVGRIRELQVTLVPSSATLDCGRATASCLNEQPATPQPLAGEHEGKSALVVPFSVEGSGQSLSLEVEPGEYLLHVEALGEDGALVANGCRPRVSLSPGKTSAESVALQAFQGPSCNARR